MASTRLDLVSTTYGFTANIVNQIYFDTITTNTLNATVTSQGGGQYNGITVLSDATYHIVACMAYVGNSGTRKMWVDVWYDPSNSLTTWENVGAQYSPGTLAGAKGNTVHATVYLRAGARIRMMYIVDVAGTTTSLMSLAGYVTRTSLAVTPSMPLP